MEPVVVAGKPLLDDQLRHTHLGVWPADNEVCLRQSRGIRIDENPKNRPTVTQVMVAQRLTVRGNRVRGQRWLRPVAQQIPVLDLVKREKVAQLRELELEQE